LTELILRASRRRSKVRPSDLGSPSISRHDDRPPRCRHRHRLMSHDTRSRLSCRMFFPHCTADSGAVSPHISPGFVARAARCRAQWGFRPRGPARDPQGRPPMGLVSRDQGARRTSMPEHRRRRATQRSATTPIGPKGCGGMGPFSSLPLLGDGGTSPSSRRLESRPMAHATDDAGGPGRASQGAERVLDSTSSTPRRENTAGCDASPAAADSW
jgi:hypothetical protein